MNISDLIHNPRFPTEETDKKATWIELFFDLIFVVTISTIAHELASDSSWFSIAKVIVLTAATYWGWVGHTFFHDRFDADDALSRVGTLVQMIGIAGVALSAHHAFSSEYLLFVLGFGVVRLVTILQFARAGHSLAQARLLTTPFAIGFSIALVPMIIALFFHSSVIRLIMTGVTVLISMIVPLVTTGRETRLPLSPSHLRERFGLFTIILLGEVLISTVSIVSAIKTPTAFILLAIAFSITFCIWWLYFQNVETTKIKKHPYAVMVYTFTHLPLALGIMFMAIGFENIIEKIIPNVSLHTLGNNTFELKSVGLAPEVVPLVLIGLSAILFSLAVLDKVTRFQGEDRRFEYQAVVAKILASLFTILLFWITLPPFFLVCLLLLIVITVLVLDIYYRRCCFKRKQSLT